MATTLAKYNLEMNMVTHIFDGWPPLQSEPEEDVKESEPFVDN